jgi:hypothetical protein
VGVGWQEQICSAFDLPTPIFHHHLWHHLTSDDIFSSTSTGWTGQIIASYYGNEIALQLRKVALQRDGESRH